MATQTTKSQTVTYTFDKASFPSLMCHEFDAGEWQDIGVSALSPEEQEGLIGLVSESGLMDHPDYDPDKLLLCKVADGILVEVYGPCVFKDGDHIVLKVGTIQVPITQKGDRISVGNLSGKISNQTKERADGSEYPVCVVNLMSPDKVFYRVRIALSRNNEPSVADIEACLLGDEDNCLFPYLEPVPSGAMKMHRLGIGEFTVKAVSSTEGQYGVNYKLHLAEGVVVYATGNSQKILENPSFTFEPGTALTLKISSIEEVGEGKYRVHNALLRRLPRLSGVPQSAEVKTLNAQVKSAEPEVPDSVLDDVDF